jgi:TonB-linked SusC/RagA family outer membrane protein
VSLPAEKGGRKSVPENLPDFTAFHVRNFNSNGVMAIFFSPTPSYSKIINQSFMRKCLSILTGVMLLFLCTEAWAQERTVTGVVTDDTGSSLPGVSVIEQSNTSNGTVTDSEGRYSLSVKEGAVLVFTFIGLKTQEVPIGDRSTVDVTMASDVTQLTEVVVTAQGIERTKNELPYAAQQVQGEDLTRTREPNFINSLSGKVSGVQITRNNSMGGSTNVVIRGNKSLTGNNQALFVVDGVPIDNSNTNSADQVTGRGGYDYGNYASDINPEDIASLTVLKGAAATALYGSRAANGVVLITTKKGSKKGLGITVNSGLTVGYIDKSTFPTFQKKYGAGYGQYYESPDGYFLYRDINGDGTKDLVTPTSEDASYGAPFDPSLMVYQWSSFDPTSPYYQQARPWVAAKNDPTKFFEHSVSAANSIMLDGGGDKGFFKLGYSRNDDKGILPNSRITKDFVNFGASFNVTDKLTAGASINFTKTNGKGRYGTGYDDKNVATNFRQWWQTNVDVKELKDAYFRTHKNITWNWQDPDALVPIYWNNPYWVRHENFESDTRSRYFGNVRLDYKINKALSVMGRVSLDSYDELQEERNAVGSLGVSSYSRFNRSFREYNYDLMLNIDHKFSDDFTLKGVVGTNIRRTTVQSILASTNGGLVVPNLYALTNSKSPLTPPVERYSDLEVDGIYASATLGFKNFVFVDLAARRDAASSLPKGNNVYYYPSISTSFVFSELLGDNPWLTGAKLRVNYAEVGNTAPTSSLLNYYDKPTPFGTEALFSVSGTRNNPNLKPERTKSFETGLEMSFIDGRVGFDVTYYIQNTVDQILPVSVSTATGYNSKYINAGDVQNQGVEVSAFGTPVKSDNFSWTMNVNWTRNRNKVKELFEIENLQLGTMQGGVSLNAALGQPYGTIRGSDYVYNENGDRVIDANGYYKISTSSNEIIGNVNPDWIGGVNNTFKFKNISLSFLVDVKRGGDVFSLDMYYGLATGLYPETAGNNENGIPVRSPKSEGGGVILPGVKEDGTPNDVRVSAVNYGLFGYVRNPAAAFVYDASYVKLREVNLTYSLPSHIVDRLKPFRGIDFSLMGRNLWIIYKNLPYADPEDNMSSGNIQGYQVGSYPMTRNVGFNIKLRF